MYTAIVEALVAAATAAAPEPVVYAVPGSPLVAERSVALLRADERLDVSVLPAPSFLDLAWAALGIDPLAERVRLVDAGEFAQVAAADDGPFLVAQCWSRHLLSEVKLALGDELRPFGSRPVVLHHLGLDDESVAQVEWWELDRVLEPDHLTSLYVPARRPGAGAAGEDAEQDTSVGVEVVRLVALMDTLREECPWDRAQTHASLMPHLVEESYEVLDALAAVAEATGDAGGGNPGDAAFSHLEEELGDLLFQIVFHSRLAVEEGRFDLADVARGVHDKLVHRHPHVFGDVTVDGADEVVSNWESIKKQEKGRSSVTEGIPGALPALMLAAKLARKARAVGVEPRDISGEEASAALSVLERHAAGAEPGADDPLSADAGEAQRLVGEVLFAVACTAQLLGIDAEQALRARVRALRAAVLEAEGLPEEPGGNR